MELKTERMIMRPVEAGDVDDLVAIHEDPLVLAVYGETNGEEVAEWIARSEAEWTERGHGRVALIDRGSGAFLGRSGLKYWPEFEEVEIGWVLAPEARGRGLATEAGRACLDWGFRDLDVPYLTAMIGPENAHSIAVAERLGMTSIREDVVLHGIPVVVFALQRKFAVGSG